MLYVTLCRPVFCIKSCSCPVPGFPVSGKFGWDSFGKRLCEPVRPDI